MCITLFLESYLNNIGINEIDEMFVFVDFILVFSLEITNFAKNRQDT